MELSRNQAFDELRKRGVDKAVVHFSGGNDEGGPTLIQLFKGDEKVGTVEEYYEHLLGREFKPGVGWVDRDPPLDDAQKDVLKRDGDLASALAKPIYDRWGSFAGEFSVDGTVEWTVVGHSVRLDYDEQSGYDHYSEAF